MERGVIVNVLSAVVNILQSSSTDYSRDNHYKGLGIIIAPGLSWYLLGLVCVIMINDNFFTELFVSSVSKTVEPQAQAFRLKDCKRNLFASFKSSEPRRHQGINEVLEAKQRFVK